MEYISPHCNSISELTFPIRISVIEGDAYKGAIKPIGHSGEVEIILQKFYECHHELVDRFGLSVSKMTIDRYVQIIVTTNPSSFLERDLPN